MVPRNSKFFSSSWALTKIRGLQDAQPYLLIDFRKNKKKRDIFSRVFLSERRHGLIPITGGHSKYDQILSVKIAKYIGFCVYHRSYLLWSPVIEAYSRHRVFFCGRTTTATTEKLKSNRENKKQKQKNMPGTW